IRRVIGPGIAFYGNAVRSFPPVYKTHMGNAPQVGVVNTEHITRPGNRLAAASRYRVISVPYGSAFGEKRRAPGVARRGVARLAVAPAHEGGAPGIAFIQPAVAEVFRHPTAVVASCRFFHAD